MCDVFRLMIWHHVVSLQQRFAAVMVEEHTAHCPLTDVVVFFITLSQLFSYFKVQIHQSSHVQFHLKYTPCLKVFDVTSTNLIPVLNEFVFCSICVFVFLCKVQIYMKQVDGDAARIQIFPLFFFLITPTFNVMESAATAAMCSSTFL